MRTKHLLVLFAVMAILPAFKFLVQENAIVGTWKSTDKEPKTIEIYLGKDQMYYGKMVSNDKQNGKLLLKKLVYDATKKVYTAALNPPDKDMTVNATVTLKNENEMVVVGKKLLMTKTINFNKIK